MSYFYTMNTNNIKYLNNNYINIDAHVILTGNQLTINKHIRCKTVNYVYYSLCNQIK